MQHDYLTLGGRVARETITTDGTVTAVLDFIYDSQGRPFALNYSTDGGMSFNTYYYVLNLQGDVVKLVQILSSSTGIQEYSEVANYTYDAWGNIISSSGTMADLNPLRYRGYYYDSETGFYYLQSRYYDPANHRFINADSPEYATMSATGLNGANLFAYCLNDPVNRTDDAGNWSWKSLFKVVAAVAVVAVVTVACVATAGAAAAAVGASAAVTSAVTTGAAVGGVVAGGANIIGQCCTVGAENINMGEVAVNTVTGSAYGVLRSITGVSSSRGMKAAARAGIVLCNSANALFAELNHGASAKEAFSAAGKAAATSAALQVGASIMPGKGGYGMKGILSTAGILIGKEANKRAGISTWLIGGVERVWREIFE